MNHWLSPRRRVLFLWEKRTYIHLLIHGTTHYKRTKQTS